MKNERSFVTGIQEAIKLSPKLRGAVVFKHAETLTSGIPDISVSILGGTSWVEVKYLRKGQKLKDIVKTLQVITCNSLATVCDGRCWIVVYEEQPEQLTIWTPRALASTLWPKMTGDRPTTPVAFPPEGSEPEDPIPTDPWHWRADPFQWVASRGAIRVQGHKHGLISRLVFEAARR